MKSRPDIDEIERGYSPREFSEVTGVPLRTVQKACAKLEPLYDPGNGPKGRRYDRDEVLKMLGYRYAKRKPGRPRTVERVAEATEGR